MEVEAPPRPLSLLAFSLALSLSLTYGVTEPTPLYLIFVVFYFWWGSLRRAQTSLDAWRGVVDTNLTAAFHVAREAFNLMRAPLARPLSLGGRIINNGSVSASSPRPGAAAYTASKHGISGLTKARERERRATPPGAAPCVGWRVSRDAVAPHSKARDRPRSLDP